MKYNDHTILDYLEAVDQRENIRPLIDGNSFWRGCIVSMLMNKYHISVLRAYDLLSVFTGKELYVKGKYYITIRDRCIDDDTIKNWQFTTVENAYRYQSGGDAFEAIKKLDSMNRSYAKVNIDDSNAIQESNSRETVPVCIDTKGD